MYIHTDEYVCLDVCECAQKLNYSSNQAEIKTNKQKNEINLERQHYENKNT